MTQNAFTYTDVVVIGAGVIGCAIARETTRFNLDVLVLESGQDIACGATRANSGIVHAGFDPLPGTTKSRFNVRGSRLYPDWAEELGFRYKRNGSMVVAREESEIKALDTLLARGIVNGVEGLRIVEGDEARKLEPSLSPDVKATLLAPTGAICDPYKVAFRALENAVSNGARIMFGSKVKSVHRDEDSWIVQTPSETVVSRAVVNAAGVHADEINNAAGAPRLSIVPVKGEYMLYDPDCGTTFTHTVFQVPTNAGKGVLVSPTVHGNLFIGPNSHLQKSKEDLSTTYEGLREILEKAKVTWPSASTRGVITNFAGLRASGESGDFVVGPVDGLPGFYNAACIDSPGLSSAPAIAVYLAGCIGRYLKAETRKGFNPRNEVPKAFSDMDDVERAEAIASDPRMGELVCRCCEVTEAEVVRVVRGAVPALTLDAVKWRCRATMGRCHGGFCTPTVLRVMSQELGVTPERIEKRASGSRVLAATRGDYLELVGRNTRRATGSSGKAKIVHGKHDVAVVGGGAAGLAAAKAAKAGGASVLLIDREERFGGILKQCVHNGFGLKRFDEELTGPEFASREIAGLAGVESIHDSSVLELRKSGGDHPLRVVTAGPSGVRYSDAKVVILATGSRERGLGALNIPGDRPSGVFTAGSAQNLMNLQGCLPGRRAVVLGSGDIGLIMARRMKLAGMEVAGVYEIAETPSGLRRNIVQCLDDFNIPLALSSTVTRIEGAARLRAVWVSKVDSETKAPVPGTESRIECDTLILSVGLIPENEVAKSIGIELDPVTGGPIVDDLLQTNVAGVFSCGNALHIHDLADNASEEGDAAGRAAAHLALGAGEGQDASATIPVLAGKNVQYVVPQRMRTHATGKEGKMSLSFRVIRTMRKPSFVVSAVMRDGSKEDVAKSSAMIAVPAEMAQISVSRIKLREAVALEVRSEERG